MIDPNPELSPDLEWMLQSGQASPGGLVETLVQEHFAHVYRLAYVILNDPDLAQLAAVKTFSESVTRLYLYRSAQGVKVWLFSLCIGVCRKLNRKNLKTPNLSTDDSQTPVSLEPIGQMELGFASHTFSDMDPILWSVVDSLEEKDRLILILHLLMECQSQEIAFILKKKELQVLRRLGIAMGECLKKVETTLHFQELSETDLDVILEGSFQRRWPERDFAESKLEILMSHVLEDVPRQAGRRKSFAGYKELALVGIVILVMVGIIWGVDHLIAPQEPASSSTNRIIQTVIVTRLVPVQSNTIAVAATETAQSQRLVQGKLTPTPFPDDVLYTVQQGETLEIIARKYEGVKASDLIALNRLPDDSILQAGQRLLIPGQLQLELRPRPTPITPAPRPLASLLSLDSTSEDVKQLIGKIAYRWNTLWIDVYIVQSGPEGYSGPPAMKRVQAWIGQDQLLLLSGSPHTGLDEVLLYSAYDGEYYRALPNRSQSGATPFTLDSETRSQVFNDIAPVFNPFYNLEGGINNKSFQIIGAEDVAGRETLIVEHSGPGDGTKTRFWIDIQTGLILRNQLFGNVESQRPEAELLVARIEFDVDFPQDMIDPRLPWRGGYAGDSSGQPDSPFGTYTGDSEALRTSRLPRRPAPEGLDPAKSRLTFQYPEQTSVTSAHADVDIFAETSFLGTYRLGNPWTMICDRSPDGLRLAYVSQPYRSLNQDAALHWIDLADTTRKIHTPLGATHVTHLAFSPDSRRLAVFAFADEKVESGSLYILDPITGDYARALHLLDARSFVWSPDGNYLALIGRLLGPQFDEHVMVIDTHSYVVLYDQSIDFENGLTQEWPMQEWGVEFPVEMGGLEACALAPGK